ncbi:unnamed protein product [Gongylonema pulchrum]|uniref:Secreted protein n=1 Tax=Gongylonema pulchrum TaxID=637853 RepID=A0A183EG38_9BILA|nr:unnamed protein product [Gongylonema pulchrum]
MTTLVWQFCSEALLPWGKRITCSKHNGNVYWNVSAKSELEQCDHRRSSSHSPRGCDLLLPADISECGREQIAASFKGYFCAKEWFS